MHATESSDIDVQSLLDREIECFRSLLHFSEKSLTNIDDFSVNVLKEMLNYRQNWIQQIEVIEEQRRVLGQEESDPELGGRLETLSEMTSALIDIDQQIQERLQKRKLSYIQQIAETTSGKSSLARHSQQQGHRQNRVDITQR